MKKIRLEINDDDYPEISERLKAAGFEIVEEDEQYVLMEKDIYVSYLSVRDKVGDRIHLPVKDIIYMESYGHNIDITTPKGRYQSSESLKRLNELLNPSEFVRISNSVIINRNHLKEIIPTLTMKFMLRMSNNDIVEVTRSYYGSFRDYMNI